MVMRTRPHILNLIQTVASIHQVLCKKKLLTYQVDYFFISEYFEYFKIKIIFI